MLIVTRCPCTAKLAAKQAKEKSRRDLCGYLSTPKLSQSESKSYTEWQSHKRKSVRTNRVSESREREKRHCQLQYIKSATFFGGNYFAVIVQSMASAPCILRPFRTLSMCKLCCVRRRINVCGCNAVNIHNLTPCCNKTRQNTMLLSERKDFFAREALFREPDADRQQTHSERAATESEIKMSGTIFSVSSGVQCRKHPNSTLKFAFTPPDPRLENGGLSIFQRSTGQKISLF